MTTATLEIFAPRILVQEIGERTPDAISASICKCASNMADMVKKYIGSQETKDAHINRLMFN